MLNCPQTFGQILSSITIPSKVLGRWVMILLNAPFLNGVNSIHFVLELWIVSVGICTRAINKWDGSKCFGTPVLIFMPPTWVKVHANCQEAPLLFFLLLMKSPYKVSFFLCPRTSSFLSFLCISVLACSASYHFLLFLLELTLLLLLMKCESSFSGLPRLVLTWVAL